MDKWTAEEQQREFVDYLDRVAGGLPVSFLDWKAAVRSLLVECEREEVTA